jgi:hypothetical protein
MGTIVRASSTELDGPARGATVAHVTQRSVQVMVLAVLIPGIHDGILKTIFVDTWISLSLFGQPTGGFKLTLIDLIILALIALAVNAIAQWLTKQKIGNLWAGMVVTILGTFVILTFVRLPAPLDFQIEDVAIIAALIGSIIIGVFYVLIRARTSKQKS